MVGGEGDNGNKRIITTRGRGSTIDDDHHQVVVVVVMMVMIVGIVCVMTDCC